MVSQDQEPAPPPQNKGKGGNNARRRSVSPPSQSDTRSISSSLASYMRMNGPVFQPQQHRLSARERGTRGVSRDKIQLAPLPEQVAAIVQQLQKPPPSVLPTQPFRLPPPSGALGMQLQRASPSSSPERQQRTEEPVSAPNLHFSWDSDFEQYLRGRVGQTGGFIRAMSESPASPGAVFEPTERSSVIWFRDNYPEPPPAHRRDVFAVQQWLEGQMQKLGRSLQQQGLLQKQQGPHKQAGPTQQPRQQQQPSPQQQQQPQQQQPQQQQQEQKQQLQQQASRVRDENQSQQGEQEQQQEHGQSEQGEDEREQGSENGDQQQDAQEPPSQAPASPTSQPPRAATDNGQGCPTQRRPSSSILSGSYTLSDDGRSSVQVARDSDGFLSTDVLIHQEKLFTRSMEELCGQAATLCVERGHLMWQMWAALRHMLRLVLQDRETSRAITREARRSELSVKGSVEAEKAVAKAEMEEVTHMNEVLNRRVLSRQAEIDQLRAKVTELEIHIASQANFNPALLQQQIEELQINVSISERQVQNLNAKLETVQRDFTEAQKEVSYLTNKLSEARSDYTSMASRLAVRTPRPSQPRMPPWELIKEEESHLTQQALREGCSPKDMHRLLLGVSFNNCNILPWVNNFMGCCRNWTPAAKGAGEEGAGGMAEAQDIADETMSIAPSRAGMGSSHSRGPSAVMHSRAGSIAAGGSTKSGTRKSKFLQPMLPPIKDLQPQLSRLLATQNVTRMQKSLPSEVVQAVSQMANHGVDPDSMACLLLGSVSPDGLELTPYKSLAGILSKRFGGTADDIGGPMTEALVMASMSTRERMEHVENQLLLKHRMAVKYRRAIAEQRKQTEDMKEQELKQQSRKIMRTPHPLTHLLSQKRCEYFVGLGTDPSVPQVLQFEGKVYCRTLEKAEAERTVHTIWRSKREFEGTHNINVTLPDYLYIFLQRKFSKAQTLRCAPHAVQITLAKM
uniref:Uncharacterized protein n=1 Tax=Dunaliella tertiolecta TaxID=3047 RepID=A0A7S3VUA7_DUNTE